MADRNEPLIQIPIHAPIADVWAHLRDPALIGRWFGWDYDGLDEEIKGIFVDGAVVDEAAHTLHWDDGPEHADRFELRADGDDTVLRLMRWAPVGDDGWDGIYDDVGEGWISFVQQLRFAIDRHLGDKRRTVFLSSAIASDGSQPFVDRLGLAGAATLDAGDRYTAVAGPGEELAGAVWFRSEHQLGLTVDRWGDGLLLVTFKPAAAEPPHGAASATLTTYGLAHDDVRSLTARWTSWWHDHVERPADAS